MVLTTHAMDECEALCERIGMMSAGKLRCLGSAQHLKGRFGEGYVLDVKVSRNEERLTAVIAAIEAAVPPGTCEVIEAHVGNVRYHPREYGHLT